MKKILILNWWDIKNPKAGGAEVYLNEVFSRLAKKGYEITLLCCRFPNSKSVEKINGIKIIRKGPAWLINITSVIWYLKNKDKFDLVIDFTNKIPYLTPLFVKSRPHIAIAHDVFGKIFVREFGILGYFLIPIEKLIFSLYKNSNFISVSKSTIEELIRIGLNPLKIKLIYGGINHRVYLPGLKSDKPLIVYVGRLKKYKRVDLLLQVFRDVIEIIPEAKLIIIGTGSEKERLKKLSQRLKLKSHVLFLGFIPENKKIKWLQKAWVTVQPSIKEGWGLTVLEAAACGTPTIASNVPGLKESVINGKTGWLFEENDTESLKNLLIDVLTNKEKRDKAKKEAIKFAQNFSWDKTTQKIEKEIKKIT